MLLYIICYYILYVMYYTYILYYIICQSLWQYIINDDEKSTSKSFQILRRSLELQIGGSQNVRWIGVLVCWKIDKIYELTESVTRERLRYPDLFPFVSNVLSCSSTLKDKNKNFNLKRRVLEIFRSFLLIHRFTPM